MDVLINKALDVGVGNVTVGNSTHFGIAGCYALQAAHRGLGAFAMTNSGPLVAPSGGRKPMLGTNPIAFAVPSGPDAPPFVLDMATSAIAYGKLENARRANSPLTPGLTLDEIGLPATDPHVAQFLMPLGGEPATSGYKGYGLGVMVDVLCGPLATALWGQHLASVMRIGSKAGLGHAFMAWRIDAFRDPDDFFHDLRQLLDELRSTAPAPGYEAVGVIAPGDPELAATRFHEAHGVSLHPTVWAELEALSDDLGIPLEELS
jgi:LDH2 family malate/lactate/ureidoglycolate dehydrogenase